MIPLRISTQNSSQLDVIPETVSPLGYAELVKRKSGVFDCTLNLMSKNVHENGNRLPGSSAIQCTIKFAKRPTLFALVSGGWLPAPLDCSAFYLVDRNVIIELERVASSSQTEVAKDNEQTWWLNTLKHSDVRFNSLLYAMEGMSRKTPTEDEFKSELENGRIAIQKAIPDGSVIQFDEKTMQHGYNLLCDSNVRYEKEKSFLVEISEIISTQFSKRDKKNQEKARDGIFSTANKHQLNRDSIVLIYATLSCLYQVGGRSPGWKVLKPKRNLSAQDAHNAISDIRNIEVAAAMQAFFLKDGSNGVALCTQDIGLAELWCAMNPKAELTKEQTFIGEWFATKDLFPQLNPKEIETLIGLVEKTFP